MRQRPAPLASFAVSLRRSIFVRLLALAVLLGVFSASSGSAEAMVCVSEEAPEESLSSVLSEYQLPMASFVAPAVAPSEERAPQRCASFGAIHCDLGLPDGEPLPPSPQEHWRSGSALMPSSDVPANSPARKTLGAYRYPPENSSDYLDELFRPPRHL